MLNSTYGHDITFGKFLNKVVCVLFLVFLCNGPALIGICFQLCAFLFFGI